LSKKKKKKKKKKSKSLRTMEIPGGRRMFEDLRPAVARAAKRAKRGLLATTLRKISGKVRLDEIELFAPTARTINGLVSEAELDAVPDEELAGYDYDEDYGDPRYPSNHIQFKRMFPDLQQPVLIEVRVNQLTKGFLYWVNRIWDPQEGTIFSEIVKPSRDCGITKDNVEIVRSVSRIVSMYLDPTQPWVPPEEPNPNDRTFIIKETGKGPDGGMDKTLPDGDRRGCAGYKKMVCGTAKDFNIVTKKEHQDLQLKLTMCADVDPYGHKITKKVNGEMVERDEWYPIVRVDFLFEGPLGEHLKEASFNRALRACFGKEWHAELAHEHYFLEQMPIIIFEAQQALMRSAPSALLLQAANEEDDTTNED